MKQTDSTIELLLGVARDAIGLRVLKDDGDPTAYDYEKIRKGTSFPLSTRFIVGATLTDFRGMRNWNEPSNYSRRIYHSRTTMK